MREGDNCVLNKATHEEIVTFCELLGKRHFDTSKQLKYVDACHLLEILRIFLNALC